jgi:hypothetical protein
LTTDESNGRIDATARDSNSRDFFDNSYGIDENFSESFKNLAKNSSISEEDEIMRLSDEIELSNIR